MHPGALLYLLEEAIEWGMNSQIWALEIVSAQELLVN